VTQRRPDTRALLCGTEQWQVAHGAAEAISAQIFEAKLRVRTELSLAATGVRARRGNPPLMDSLFVMFSPP